MRSKQRARVPLCPKDFTTRLREAREAFAGIATGVVHLCAQRWRFHAATAGDGRPCPVDGLLTSIEDALAAHDAAGTPPDRVMELMLALPRTLEAQIRARLSPKAPTSFQELLLEETRSQGTADVRQNEALMRPNDPAAIHRAVVASEEHAQRLMHVAAEGRKEIARLNALRGAA